MNFTKFSIEISKIFMTKSVAIDLTYKQVEELCKAIVRLYNKEYSKANLPIDSVDYFELYKGLLKGSYIPVPKPDDFVDIWQFISKHSLVDKHEKRWSKHENSTRKVGDLVSKFKPSNLRSLFKYLIDNKDSENKSDHTFGGGVHRNLYFRLLGYENAEAFVEYLKTRLRTGDYLGLYYSPDKNDVGQFAFRIEHFGDTTAKLTNLKEFLPDKEFKGTGIEHGQYWHFKMVCEQYFLDIVIDTGAPAVGKDNFKLNNLKIFVSGVLPLGMFSSEAFLISKKNDKLSKDEANARKYLMVSRKTNKFNKFHPHDFTALDRINIARIHDLRLFLPFFNTKFRIINKTSDNLISQSQITIKNDLSCSIIYPVRPGLGEPKVYTGFISVKNNLSNKFFIQVYINDTFHAYTIVHTTAIDGRYVGAFSISDSGRDGLPTGGEFSMVKDNDMVQAEIAFFTKQAFIEKYSEPEGDRHRMITYAVLCSIAEDDDLLE